MYLSRISLNRQHPAVRQALSDSTDMHRNIMAMFNTTRLEAGALFRVRDDGKNLKLYVLSENEPVVQGNGMELEAGREISDFLLSFEKGKEFGFDLIASPCKKVARGDGGHSRRRTLHTRQEREDWLKRKGNQYGFEVVSLSELEQGRITAVHKREKGGKLSMDTTHFYGVLRVEDADKFRLGWTKGFGPGKAYGCGLMLLKPL